MLKIDLGCGTAKADGFIGFDRFSLPGVDIVGDLDKPLPFDSNSADLIYASHSLEHVPNLMGTMAEIYRVMRHGGQLCIVAPYSEQKLNIANPYHLNNFNEHTPRFWTNYPTSAASLHEYDHPHATNWGIADSDHSTPTMDFRLLAMEFFYFPPYLGYSEDVRRTLRQQCMDVCDQVMYHLIAWKPEQEKPGETLDNLLKSFVPYTPDYIIARRAADAERESQATTLRSAPHALALRNELYVSQADRLGGDHVIDLVGSLVAELFSTRERARELEVAKRFEAEKQVAFLKAEIDVSDALIAEYLAQTEDFKDTIKNMQDKINDQGELITRSASAMDHLETQLLNLKNENLNLSEYITALKSNIDQITGSVSWRVTTPLRMLRKLF